MFIHDKESVAVHRRHAGREVPLTADVGGIRFEPPVKTKIAQLHRNVSWNISTIHAHSAPQAESSCFVMEDTKYSAGFSGSISLTEKSGNDIAECFRILEHQAVPTVFDDSKPCSGYFSAHIA